MEFLDNFTLKETKASKELYENPPENIINDAKVQFQEKAAQILRK